MLSHLCIELSIFCLWPIFLQGTECHTTFSAPAPSGQGLSFLQAIFRLQSCENEAFHLAEKSKFYHAINSDLLGHIAYCFMSTPRGGGILFLFKSIYPSLAQDCVTIMVETCTGFLAYLELQSFSRPLVQMPLAPLQEQALLSASRDTRTSCTGSR